MVIRRLTSREFLAALFLMGYALTVTIGGYTVPEVVKTLLLPAIVIGAGWRLATKNGT